MNGTKLGDTYDFVKRVWHDLLNAWARYMQRPSLSLSNLQMISPTVTGIPMLQADHPPLFSIFNDPDAGVPPFLVRAIKV